MSSKDIVRPTRRRRPITALAIAMAVMGSTTALGGHVIPPELLATTSLNLSASPTTVTYPQPTELSGKLVDKHGAGIAQQAVRIEFERASAQSWSTATTQTTDADGVFRWAARLSSTSHLRALFDGSQKYAGSQTGAVTVNVRPVLGFDERRVLGQGQKTRVGGAVAPSVPGRGVKLEYLNGGKWLSTGKSTTVDRTGHWGIDVTYTTFGDRTLRAQLASSADNLAATSPQRTMRVTYPFQTVVSTGSKPRVDIVRVASPDGGCTIGLGRILAGATKVELHPGQHDPGGSWKTPNSLTPNERPGAVAAFNSGFAVKSSRGGFLLEGVQAYPLRSGAASIVPISDGTWRLGTWGHDVDLSSRVVSVRQNLELLVDNSKVLSSVDSDIQGRWGATFSAATYTWRSGIGIDPAGNLVYVMGPCLSPRLVAQALVNGGAVRAMELDVNVYWPAFDYYTASSTKSAALTPHTLLPNEHNPANHYFTSSSRDFFTVHLR